MKEVVRPRVGAEVVLSMRRGRTMKDKKHLQVKYACRKTKGGRVCITGSY
jgi:hypothetical protein